MMATTVNHNSSRICGWLAYESLWLQKDCLKNVVLGDFTFNIFV